MGVDRLLLLVRDMTYERSARDWESDQEFLLLPLAEEKLWK